MWPNGRPSGHLGYVLKGDYGHCFLYFLLPGHEATSFASQCYGTNIYNNGANVPWIATSHVTNEYCCTWL